MSHGTFTPSRFNLIPALSEAVVFVNFAEARDTVCYEADAVGKQREGKRGREGQRAREGEDEQTGDQSKHISIFRGIPVIAF